LKCSIHQLSLKIDKADSVGSESAIGIVGGAFGFRGRISLGAPSLSALLGSDIFRSPCSYCHSLVAYYYQR
jgi:hypothetical protein